MNFKRDQTQFDNKLCKKQLDYFVKGLVDQDFWALKMFDSWAKVQSGISSGNTMNFGDFQQCLDTQHSSEDIQIKGQYCMVFYKYTDKLKKDNVEKSSLSDIFNYKEISKFAKINNKKFGSGICVPSSCNEDMIRSFANEQLREFNLELATDYNQDLFCKIDGSKSVIFPLNPLIVLSILIFSTIFILLIASTIYDLIMRKCYQKEPEKLFIAFSLYTNFNNLFDIQSENKNDIGCFLGIKVLSLFGVILGHRLMHCSVFPKENAIDFLNEIPNSYISIITWHVCGGVDNFLIIASVLLTMKLLKSLDSKINIWFNSLRRYMSITPTIALLLLIIAAFPHVIPNSPMFSGLSISQNCKTYWWSTLLHIQNYVNPNNLCLDWTWYLSVDIQLAFITPFLIYPAWKYGLKYLLAIPAIIAIVNIFIYYEMIRNELPVLSFPMFKTTESSEAYLSKLYYPTHTRCIPWLMGILLGFKLHHLRGKKEVINKYIKALLWTLSLGSIIISSFKYVKYNSLEIDTTTYEDHALFYVTAKMFFSLSIVWIIFACHNGDGGIIQRFLSNSMWKPISKMSLSIFLLHVVLQIATGFESRKPMYFSVVASVKAIRSYFKQFI
ncbi:unnamed protein product [Diamesa serratosioi]